MSVIEATSGTYRSRVDGTLVLTVEIEPMHREAALKLFGQPGTSMALAALRVGHAAKSDQTENGPGYWAWQAINLCKDPDFWRWIHEASMGTKKAESEAEARFHVLTKCGVKSRGEFDTDMAARQRFVDLIHTPFTKWQKVPA
jgi:hypothetical protein